MQNKYVDNWHVELLPNGVYLLMFNTKDKWIGYHQFDDNEYTFFADAETENYHSAEHIVKIPDFLPKIENGGYRTSHSQEKDQIYYYFIPYYHTQLLNNIEYNKTDVIEKVFSENVTILIKDKTMDLCTRVYKKALSDMYDYCINNVNELTKTKKSSKVIESEK
jgi:hypothetical protein